LPLIASREAKAGPEIRVADTKFGYFASCRPYKSSNVERAVFDLDAPALMDLGGNLGEVSTRVLHYHYNCGEQFQHCRDEEQFYLGKGYGLCQWKHFRNSELLKTALMNDFQPGKAKATLPCEESYH
jgi:hypothetical protein